MCKNRGPWHLGISKDACENTGGSWHRSPCVLLKKCIDDRPSRFQLDAPNTGNCQDTSMQLGTNYVSASMSDANFPFYNNKAGCLTFCQKLPEYSLQTGMEVSTSYCTCHYKDEDLPSKDVLPKYAIRSLPKFSLKDPTGKFVLGLSPQGDCKSNDISIQVQAVVDGNRRQQFQITRGGRIVSPSCSEKALLIKSDQCSTRASLQVSTLAPDPAQVRLIVPNLRGKPTAVLTVPLTQPIPCIENGFT